MQTPDRFGTAVRSALELELPSLRPTAFRARFRLSEESDAEDLVAIARRGSDGVILKAPHSPPVVEAVDGLAATGIPVVTFVTDLPFSRRVAYVGVDNRAAGATAAYLVTHWSGAAPGGVLVTLSSATFRGEEERGVGFRATPRELSPTRSVVEVTDTDGLDSSMLRAVGEALQADPSLDAVYSIGGGNTATLAAFRAAGRTPAVFIAPDLDGDTHVDETDLDLFVRADMRRACRSILQAQGALPGVPVSVPSQIHVVTPYNEPGALAGADAW